MIARVYSNCMIAMVLTTAFGLLCIAAADGTDKFLTAVVSGVGVETGGSLGIHKHIFNFNMALAGGWFALGMAFIVKMRARGNKYFTPINFNVIGAILASLLLVGTSVFGLGGSDSVQGEGAGMLFGSAFSTVSGGIIAIVMALAKQDSPEEAEGE